MPFQKGESSILFPFDAWHSPFPTVNHPLFIELDGTAFTKSNHLRKPFGIRCRMIMAALEKGYGKSPSSLRRIQRRTMEKSPDIEHAGIAVLPAMPADKNRSIYGFIAIHRRI